MILDEIQTGFGRTGQLFAHQKYGVIPDIMLVGKAMGGGMPIAGFVTSLDNMIALTKNPMLGHITTFGGHPVSCAAAEACLDVLLSESYVSQVDHKASLIESKLTHAIVKEVRHVGLIMAVELTHRKYLKHVVGKCMKNGLIIDYFLFNDSSFRIAPPLIISEAEIEEACGIMLEALEHAAVKYRH